MSDADWRPLLPVALVPGGNGSMPDPFSVIVVSELTARVFAHLLDKGLAVAGDPLRAWLKKEPPRLAFQAAFISAYTTFARQHPTWTASLMDETFLGREDVTRELGRFLTRTGHPDPAVLSDIWAAYLPLSGVRNHLVEGTRVLADFLGLFEEELKNQEALRPIWDSRTLEQISENAEGIAALLRVRLQTLAEAVTSTQLSVQGSVSGSVLISGQHNIVNQTVISSYPALADHIYDFTGLMDDLTRWFEGREFVFAEVEDFIRSHDCGLFRLVADAGLGKSAIAAALAKFYKAPVFFFGHYGSTNPARCLEHLCADLIARFQLDHRHLPARAGEDANFLSALLREAHQKAEYPVVMIIDALDEAEGGAPSGYWIPLPDPLPKRAYILITHRPGEYSLPGAQAVILDLAWDDPRQSADIERHLRRQAQRPEVQHALATAEPPISSDRFVTALTEASEGNFMYLQYVLQDMTRREPGFDPLQLQVLPRGLPGYYDLFWKRMEKAKEAEGWGEWRSLYKPILALLAVAGEAVDLDWLAAHAQADAGELSERIIQPWRRFLRAERRDNRVLWHIIHGSFGDFLAGKVELIPYHRQVAAYYLEGPERWKTHGGYPFRRLSRHLAKAGMLDELGSLVENSAWYTAQTAYDATGSAYARDVGRALALAERQVLEHRESGRALPAVVAWSLLYARVRSQATRIPLEALEALAMLGQLGQALSYAALMYGPELQAEAFGRIALRMSACGESQTAQDVASRALEAAQAISDESHRAKALSQLSGILVKVAHGAGLRQALEVARDIAEEGRRVEALTGIAEAMAELGDREGLQHALQAALDVDEAIVGRFADDLAPITSALVQLGDREALQQVRQAIEDDQDCCRRPECLTVVAGALALVGEEATAREALHTALRSATDIVDEPRRAMLLAELAGCLVQVGEETPARELAHQALQIVQSIEDHALDVFGLRDSAVAAVAKTMARLAEPEGIRKVLLTADSVQDDYRRCHSLVRIAEALAEAGEEAPAREAVLQALQVAQEIADQESRNYALGAVVETLAQVGPLDLALRMAQTIEIESKRADALAAVARALAQADDPDGLHKCLQAAQAIEEEWDRTRALAEIARAWAQVGVPEGLHHVLGAAHAIGQEGLRARVLAAVVEAFVQLEYLDQALQAAQAIGDDEYRAYSIATTGRALAQKGLDVAAWEAVREALQAAGAIGMGSIAPLP